MRCESCGSEVVHLQGATGRIAICGRCGWGKLELAKGHEIATDGVRHDSAQARQMGRKAGRGPL